MSKQINDFQAIVVGAGHAGCVACLALARLGLKEIVFTVSVDSIAMMPCNPSIGGTSKGHLVREVDALGGQMGITIDETFIQSKMLNRSKGPAVHSLRAQADKKAYSQRMREIMESEENLTIRQGEVDEILVEGGIFKGIKTHTGVEYLADVCVLCTGTYLNSRCITGETSTYTGPNGLQAATHLSDSLKNLGLNLRRFKTGTPARMDGKTIDYEKMQTQYGDDHITQFSFTNIEKEIQKQQAL